MISDTEALPSATVARLRPMDVSATLDAVLGRPPGDLLESVADAARVGVAGHSFGGWTALRIAGATLDADAMAKECATSDSLVCDGWAEDPSPPSARDDRFVASLAQAPGGSDTMFAGSRDGFEDVTVPTMIQAGTADQLTPFDEEARAPYEGLPPPAWLLAVEDAGHFTFSDVCFLVEDLDIPVAEFEDGCGPDNIPYEDAHALVNTFATAFFQVHLAGVVDFESVLDPGEPPPTGITSFDAK